MMEGIQVLNVISYEEFIPGISPIFFILAIICIVGFVCFIIGLAIEDINIGAFGILLAVIGFLFSFLSYNTYDTQTLYKYEVLVDDSVSMNVFTERYNIVSHRGEIYKIEDKDPELRLINRMEN